MSKAGKRLIAAAEEATRSIEIADRRRRLARLVLICDPAMVTALEGVLGLRGGT